MISLRKGKSKFILDASINSAISAVEIYNKPNARFRTETFIVLMIIAWTKLFHAFFQATIGEKYFYKNDNKRFTIVNGEKRAWELSECIKQFNKQKGNHHTLSQAVMANIQFFIGIRNKIEHRHYDSSDLDINLFGECQSLLYNYEKLLLNLFGTNYSLNASLAYSLQFSQLRTPQQFISQRSLASKQIFNIKEYIKTYRSKLPQPIFDSSEFSIKLFLVPKVSNNDRGALPIEFVKWSPSDSDKYDKLLTIIKDKVVKIKTANADMLKPKQVIDLVNQHTMAGLTIYDHSLLWKAFDIRPSGSDSWPNKTNEEFCIYDDPHKDYVYSLEWVKLLIYLINAEGFSQEKIRQLKETKLNVDDYNYRNTIVLS